MVAGGSILIKAENRIDLVSMIMHRAKAWLGNLAPYKGWMGKINVGNFLKVKEPDLDSIDTGRDF